MIKRFEREKRDCIPQARFSATPYSFAQKKKQYSTKGISVVSGYAAFSSCLNYIILSIYLQSHFLRVNSLKYMREMKKSHILFC